MAKHVVFLSYSVLVLAIIAWAGFGYVVYSIGKLESSKIATSQSAQQNDQQMLQASFLHSVVIGSAAARAQLDSLAVVDPASLADLVTGAGHASGINLLINSATAQSTLSIDGKTTVQTFTLLCSSQGSFASVSRAVQLLETLPLPSSIQKIEFSHAIKTPATAAVAATAEGEWQMNAQVQVISIGNTSS